jgi:tryptophan-rich sensory protein
MRGLSMILWLALCFSVAALGARWTTTEIPTWYRALVHPSFAPPNWLFGPVWTLLYALMAFAAWRITQAPASPLRTWGLALFLVQLALNLAWSWIFFRQHAIGVAVAEIVLLWVAIAATTLVFARISPFAAGLMAPYLAWVAFAALLNAAYWRLN